ncbi:MAG: hypothetical protein AAGC95_13305 [Pseudomonadota bacterium]
MTSSTQKGRVIAFPGARAPREAGAPETTTGAETPFKPDSLQTEGVSSDPDPIAKKQGRQRAGKPSRRKKPPDPQKQKARSKAKALRKLQRLARTVEATDDASQWEHEFIASLEERVDAYGAAFRDQDKGGQGEALSYLQAAKLKEIDAKLRKAKRKADKGEDEP